MIIECPICKAKVDSKVLTSTPTPDNPEELPFQVSLVVCPSCKHPLLAGQELIQTGPDSAEWSSGFRLWPDPRANFSWSIPLIVRTSLEESDKCLRAGAYAASVAMSGRALEGVCRHFKTKSQYLGGGLKELLDKQVIDGKLYQWSQELHRQRNMAAHATEEKVLQNDATALLEFVTSICEYVFVLTAKFDEFMKRKMTKPKQ